MNEKFVEALKCTSGATAYSMWKDLNDGPTDNVDSIKSINEFFDFFSYAIMNNIIVEYDQRKNQALFSGDAPDVVVKRIFEDFFEKNPNLPKVSPEESDDFIAYMLVKRGWAVLCRGTYLMLPD